MYWSKHTCFSDLSVCVCECVCETCSALLLVEPAKGKASAASLSLGRDPGSPGHWDGLQQWGKRSAQTWNCWRWWALETPLNFMLLYHRVIWYFPKLMIFFFFLILSFKVTKVLCLWRHGPQWLRAVFSLTSPFRFLHLNKKNPHVQLKSLSVGLNLVIIL